MLNASGTSSVTVASSGNGSGDTHPLDLHRAVFERDIDSIERLLQIHDMRYYDVHDTWHNTPLSLAIKLGFAEISTFLVASGSDITFKSNGRFTIIDEVLLSCRHFTVFREIFYVMQSQGWKKWQTVLDPGIRSTMRKTPDFYMEVQVKLEGNFLTNALLSYFAPTETYKIWKKGPRMRLDFTVKGLTDSMTVKRGNLSLLLVPSVPSDPNSVCHLYKLDHDKRTKKNMLRRMFNPTEAEVQQFVNKLLEAHKDNHFVEALHLDIDHERAKVYEAKTLLGWPKKENLNGKWHCKLCHVNMKVKATMCSKEHNPESLLSRTEYFEDKPYGILPVSELTGNRNMKSRQSHALVDDEADDSEDIVNEESASGALPLAEDEVDGHHHAGSSSAALDHIKQKTALNRKVVSTIWLTDDLPLSSSDLMPIIEIIGLEDARMEKFQVVMEKCREVISQGCPVKLTVPLLLGIHASMTLVDVDLSRSVDDSHFKIPEDYKDSN